MVEKNLKHVIQCMPDGSIEMTLKDGELKPFNGHRTIKRMSEILFDEASQHFYIVFKQDGTRTPAIFPTYEEAINYEVSTINKKRLMGVTFNESL